MCPSPNGVLPDTTPPKTDAAFLNGERFGRYSNQNSSFALRRESARALSHRHGYPGHVHPADRLGQTVAAGPGCLATRTPANLAGHFSVLFLFWNPRLAASPSIAAGSCPATLLLRLRASSPEPRANPLQ